MANGRSDCLQDVYFLNGEQAHEHEDYKSSQYQYQQAARRFKFGDGVATYPHDQKFIKCENGDLLKTKLENAQKAREWSLDEARQRHDYDDKWYGGSHTGIAQQAYQREAAAAKYSSIIKRLSRDIGHNGDAIESVSSPGNHQSRPGSHHHANNGKQRSNDSQNYLSSGEDRNYGHCEGAQRNEEPSEVQSKASYMSGGEYEHYRQEQDWLVPLLSEDNEACDHGANDHGGAYDTYDDDGAYDAENDAYGDEDHGYYSN